MEDAKLIELWDDDGVWSISNHRRMLKRLDFQGNTILTSYRCVNYNDNDNRYEYLMDQSQHVMIRFFTDNVITISINNKWDDLYEEDHIKYY